MSTDPQQPTDEDAPAHPFTADEWDERYRSAERLWTTKVNPSLVAETSDLRAGTALEVGTGEGADARWLADRGWEVLAVDISRVAIERAGAGATQPRITWRELDVMNAPIPGRFDLVTAHYFPVPAERSDVAVALIDAVAPGGTLLIVAHAPEGMRAHGFDPADYVQPSDVAALLGAGWTIDTHETRPRGRAAGGGHHVDDAVLRAHRA